MTTRSTMGTKQVRRYRNPRPLSPPLALGWLVAPPEFFDESEDERLAGLDLPAPAIAHDE